MKPNHAPPSTAPGPKTCLLMGFALSLLGSVLLAAALWLAPTKWFEHGPVWLRGFACIALIFLPGMLRVIHLLRTERVRQGGYTLLGCLIGTVLLAMLGFMLLMIAASSGMPRHD